MANVKITELTALNAAETAATDVFPIVDVDADATKKISVSDLLRGAPDGTLSAPGFAFANDSNSGLYRIGTDNIALVTNGAARILIDANGDVTIPNTAIITSSEFGSGTAAAPSITFTNDTDAGIYSPGANQVAISTNGTGRLFVDSSGNVVIGATTAGAKFHVNVGTDQNISFNSDGINSRISAFNDAVSASVPLVVNGSDLRFTTSGTERLRITSAGLVGIGTSSPGRLLEVSSSTDATIRINDPATIGAVDRYIGGIEYYTNDSSGGAKVACSIKGYHVDISGNGRLQFATGNETIAMTIDGSQRVGIGTTSPSGKLDIVTGGSGGNVLIDAESGSGYHAKIVNDTGDLVVGSRNTSADSFITSQRSIGFRSGSSETERMRIDSSGRLLVGTSSARSVGLGSAYPAPFQVETTNYAAASFTNNSNDLQPAYLNLGKSRGGIGSNTIVQSGDYLGQVGFAGADGNDLETLAATITCVVDGTPGANDMPGRLVFSTTADGASSPTERMRITNSGNVGIGTASPITYTNYVTLALSDSNGSVIDWMKGSTLQGSIYNAGDNFYIEAKSSVPIIFGTNGAVRMQIDSSGRLLVGTSSARTNFHNNASYSTQFQIEGTNFQNSALSLVCNNTVDYESTSITLAKSGGSTIGSNTLVSNGESFGLIRFEGSDGTNFVEGAGIRAEVDGTPGANDMPGRLVFSTTADGASSPTERMRIKQDGGTHVFGTADIIYAARSGYGAGTTYMLFQGAYNASGTLGTGTESYRVFTNGNVQNTNNSYTGISDVKLKENIVDASSQWDDIKALRPVNYNFKEGQTHTQIGLIAQEVELVSPGLVSESPDRDGDGNDLGTVTKSVNYSVLYMKAVKALQEAMERIETLEAKVAALEPS